MTFFTGVWATITKQIKLVGCTISDLVFQNMVDNTDVLPWNRENLRVNRYFLALKWNVCLAKEKINQKVKIMDTWSGAFWLFNQESASLYDVWTFFANIPAVQAVLNCTICWWLNFCTQVNMFAIWKTFSLKQFIDIFCIFKFGFIQCKTNGDCLKGKQSLKIP